MLYSYFYHACIKNCPFFPSKKKKIKETFASVENLKINLVNMNIKRGTEQQEILIFSCHLLSVIFPSFGALVGILIAKIHTLIEFEI